MGKGEEHSIQKEQPNAKALVHEINGLLVRLEWYERWEGQGLGLAKVVWDLIINIGYTSMEEIGFHPKGSGKSLESFREGRDTRMIQDPCLPWQSMSWNEGRN